MIKLLKSGDRLDRIFKRRSADLSAVMPTVTRIVDDVRKNGDRALIKYRRELDRLDCPICALDEEIENAYKSVTEAQLSALRRSRDNVYDFHVKQKRDGATFESGGKTLGWTYRPVSCAGIYVPGGKANYPSTVVMCAMAAKAAGVPHIVMCTPGASPLTLVAAKECGVNEVYKVGGAQAIAAMAFGTESIKKADVIVGPGNIYVAAAKKAVFGDVNIDMIAGPSEIVVVADKSARPDWITADILSQAEHDELAMAVLITHDKNIAEAVVSGMQAAIERSPRRDIIEKSIDSCGTVVLTENLEESLKLADRIAPEHLELCVENADDALLKIHNAGCVFLGNYASEPVGDYYAGSNHVLPTGGTARAFSGLGTDTFLKRVNYVRYDRERLIADATDIIELATAEGLYAHAQAVKIRTEKEKR